MPITIQCDASSEGLGTVLLQDGHPVSFASRTLTKSEKRYAQIEKELAAIVFSFEKFHYYVYGHQVLVQTDHKPLIPIFSKSLDNVSARLQRMLLRLLKYNVQVTYLPGKHMLVADILSRCYIKDEVQDDPEMQYVIHTLYTNLAMSENKKALFKKATQTDNILSQIKQFCETNWPSNDKKLGDETKIYYKLKESICLSQNLLFLDSKIIVPSSLRAQMLTLIHEPHFGIQKTKSRARQLFYWPHMSKDIENFIINCKTCQLNQRANQKETLVSHPLPTRPWQYLFSDFFSWHNKNYLLVVDSFSNWVEVTETKTKTCNEVTEFCKRIFSQFGVPDIFYCDNVPYNSRNFKEFASNWNFEIIFSSPHHHQSNGLAERYVGIVKEMLRKANSDRELPVLLMEYRNTPLPNIKYSPAQLLLNRVVKTKIPVSTAILAPTIPVNICDKIKKKYSNQKYFYDKNAKDLKKLQVGQTILFQKNNSWNIGKILEEVNDRSYLLTDTFGSTFRRNRIFLKETSLPFKYKTSQLYDYNLGSYSTNENGILRENLNSSNDNQSDLNSDYSDSDKSDNHTAIQINQPPVDNSDYNAAELDGHSDMLSNNLQFESESSELSSSISFNDAVEDLKTSTPIIQKKDSKSTCILKRLCKRTFF